jgi:hypothetical protein
MSEKPLQPEQVIENEGEGQFEWEELRYPVIPPLQRIESGPVILEIEALFAQFEAEHPVAELYGIIDLTPYDAPLHPTREPARLALIPLVAKLNILENETDISEETFNSIKEKYKYYSRAVGMISGGKVDHER